MFVKQLKTIPLNAIRVIGVALFVAASLISGILTGWNRLGISLPTDNIALHHGAIMTGSFLGTVILIERIVTLKRMWLFLFPIINATSTFFFFLDQLELAQTCLILGAIGLVYVFYLINKWHSDLPHQIMWFGASALLIGNSLLFLTNNYAAILLWWMAFLLLTICGERLELSKLLPVSHVAKQFFVTFLLLFIIACIAPFHSVGRYLAGVALFLNAAWLLKFDMIWKSVKRPGIHRFTAINLFLGYIWLAICGLFYLFEVSGSIPYDSLVHSFFLGFVFSMIFAHAPIILPGVLGLTVRPFHLILYLWVALFQASLLIRIISGLTYYTDLKKWGGFLNGMTILLFIITTVILTLSKTNRASKA